MAITLWFDEKAYFNNKLAAMGPGWDSLALRDAFIKAGYNPDSTDYMLAHFVNHGNGENVSPNSLFDPGQYLAAKAAQYYKVANATGNQIKSVQTMIEQAGMTLWDHYNMHGWAESGGIDPSIKFDSSQYLEDKLAQMQVTNPGYTMPQLIAAFKAAGLSPLTHFFNHGAAEGLTAKSVPDPGPVDPVDPIGPVGTTFDLTTGRDNFNGTAGNDYFYAKLGDLNDNDYLEGHGGFDILRAEVGYPSNGSRAIEPTLSNIDKVIIQAQDNNNDTGSNNPSLAGKEVDIDAGGIRGMYYLQNDESRADLTVEDVRTPSSRMTIALTDTDPGDVDFNVYFDPTYLTGEKPGSTLNLRLMDVRYADESNGARPLQTNIYDSFKLLVDGKFVVIDLKAHATASDYTGPTATYDTLVRAFQDAIKHATVDGVANVDLSGTISVLLGEPFTGHGGAGTHYESDAGRIVVLTSTTATLQAGNGFTNTGWDASGQAPANSAYSTSVDPLSTCPLIVTDIHLDNVGRVKWDQENPNCLPANAINGSKAGDMVVGSMATTGGVERFNVTVDEGSWLASLSSTNNTLRMIQAVNGNVDSKVADGQLFIGSSLAAAAADGNLVDFHTNLAPRNPAGNPGSWIDMPKLLTTDGLTDVKVFDGSEMIGNINIGAQITKEAFPKYNKDVDGLRTVYDSYAPNLGTGEFVYNLGKSADTLNMTVDGGIAADIDFGLQINAGAGNDFVNFRYTDLTSNQLAILRTKNINSNMNVKINGDAGSDTIKTWGDGAITVNGGAGNDAIYVGQTDIDQNAVFLFNVGVTGTAVAPIAAPIPNTMIYVDDVFGAQPLANDLLGDVYSFNYSGAVPNAAIRLEVSFFGHTVRTDIKNASATGSGTMTAEEINKAIIRAINEDAVLSKLLVAKDGAGYSLMVEALVDGALSAGDLTVDFIGATVANEVAYEVTTIASGATELLDTSATRLTDTSVSVNYHLNNTQLGSLGWSNGDIIQIKIGDEIYAREVTALTVATEAQLLTALRNAIDKNGVALDDRYDITAGTFAGDGVFILSSETGAGKHVSTNIDISRMDALGNNVTGTDLGTRSHNIVNGGAGNDVIVLNANNLNALYNDTVVMSAGRDVIYGFETGIDKIDVSAFNPAGATLPGVSSGSAVAGNQFTAAQILAEHLAVTGKGVYFLESGTSGIYTAFTYDDSNSDGFIDRTVEIVDVIGTVEFINGTFVATDILV